MGRDTAAAAVGFAYPSVLVFPLLGGGGSGPEGAVRVRAVVVAAAAAA